METKKNPDYDINNKRKGLLQLGLISALALCLSAFEYTDFSYEREPVAGIEIEMIEEPKIFIPKPPEPKPPRPEQQRNDNSSSQQNAQNVQQATQINVTNSDPSQTTVVLPGNELKFDQNLYKDEPVIAQKDFTVVEDMPYYKEFEKIKNRDKRNMATDSYTLKFLHGKLVYPVMAKETGVQGTVYVSYRVNKEGEVEDVQILRGVHPDLDAEAVRVVKLLPDMVPGKQRGEVVNVRYMVPIEFQLR